MKHKRRFIALLLVLLMVLTQILEGALGKDTVNIWVAAMLTSALMLITRCMSADQARRSIDWCVPF